LAFEVPNGFNPERGFPRRKNALTRTLIWSDVRMHQPRSTTLRLPQAATVICAIT